MGGKAQPINIDIGVSTTDDTRYAFACHETMEELCFSRGGFSLNIVGPQICIASKVVV